MALLRHGTVNFHESEATSSGDADDRVTLIPPASAEAVAVHFCTTPFEVDDKTLCELVGSLATLSPQPLSVVVSAESDRALPELPLLIQSYCATNQDVLKLGSIISSDEAAKTETWTASVIDNDVVLYIGNAAAFEALVQAQADANRTFLYMPDNAKDQLNFFQLIDIASGSTVVPLINTQINVGHDKKQFAAALLQAIDIAIASDSQFFHWIEGNAGQINAGNTDALAMLIARFCTSVCNDGIALLEHDTDFVNQLTHTTGNEPEVMAALIALKVHIAVLTELLPDGADARVLHLLHSIGFEPGNPVVITSLNAISDSLLLTTNTLMLTEIGVVSDEHTPEPKIVSQAIHWLQQQHDL